MTNFDKNFYADLWTRGKNKSFFCDEKANQLRLDLISEELEELKCDAIQRLEIADALTDILYVTYGQGMHLE